MSKKENKMKKRTLLAMLTYVLFIALTIYVGGWVLFIKPILACCVAFDAGNLTAIMVGLTFINFLCAGIVSSVLVIVGQLVTLAILGK